MIGQGRFDIVTLACYISIRTGQIYGNYPTLSSLHGMESRGNSKPPSALPGFQGQPHHHYSGAPPSRWEEHCVPCGGPNRAAVETTWNLGREVYLLRWVAVSSLATAYPSSPTLFTPKVRNERRVSPKSPWAHQALTCSMFLPKRTLQGRSGMQRQYKVRYSTKADQYQVLRPAEVASKSLKRHKSI